MKENTEHVEDVAKMVYEILLTIGDPEYAEKIYSIVYAAYIGR